MNRTYTIVYYPTPFSCDSSTATWLGLAVFFLVFRVLILGLVWLSWFQQTAARRKASRSAASRVQEPGRFPLIPFVSTIDTVLFALIVILGSLNIITGKHGETLVLIIFWMFAICAIQIATLKKMVGLGGRIFKFDLNSSVSSSSSSSHLEHAEKYSATLNKVATFDNLLKILSSTMFILLVLTAVFAFVGLDPVLGPMSDFLVARLAVACLTLEQILLYTAMMYQYSRCIACVQTIARSSSSSGEKKDDSSYQRAFTVAIARMRYQQLVMFITGLVTGGLLLYLVITLQLYWWTIVCALALDCFIYFSMVMSFFRFRNRNKKSKTTVPSAGEADGGANIVTASLSAPQSSIL